MANGPLVDIRRFIKKSVDLVGKDAVNRKVLTELGVLAVERIRKRTRLGYGVESEGAKRKKLKDMRLHSPMYSTWRKDNKDKLSKLTRPSKVNLTLSGKMLGQLRIEKINVGGKSVVLGFSERESQEKAEVNIKRGWRFLTLSDVEQKALTNQYQRIVNALVRGLR